MTPRTMFLRAASLLIVLLAVSLAVYPWLARQVAIQSNSQLQIPFEYDVGVVESTKRFELPIENVSEGTLSVQGAKTDCGCIVPSNLPITLQPGDTAYLDLEMVPKKTVERQELSLRLQLITDTKLPLPPTIITATVAPTKHDPSETLEPIPAGDY